MTSKEERAFTDREGGAAILLAVLAVGVPIAAVLVMLYISAILDIFGDKHVHEHVWGWLSHKRQIAGWTDDKGHHNGYTEWSANSVGLKYFICVVTAYLTYQIGEGLFQGGREFARYLAK